MRIVNIGVLSAMAFAACRLAAQGCGGHGDASTMLVTGEWVAAHAHDAGVVLLAVGQKSEFDQGHIPGSQFLDYNLVGLRATPEHPNALELPPMADLAAAFSQLGVSNSSRVVLYMTKDAISQLTRVYWTLDAMGMGARTSLLDGGLPEWQRQARPVTVETAAARAGKLTPCPQSDVLAELEYVKANLRRPGVDIVDARAPNYYSGETPGRNMRPGHIPGAVSVPFSTVVDGQTRFLPAEQLRKRFEDAGVKPGDRVVTYCHIGQQATVIYFVARYLGFDARLYDGSFEEWSRRGEPNEVSQR